MIALHLADPSLMWNLGSLRWCVFDVDQQDFGSAFPNWMNCDVEEELEVERHGICLSFLPIHSIHIRLLPNQPSQCAGSAFFGVVPGPMECLLEPPIVRVRKDVPQVRQRAVNLSLFERMWLTYSLKFIIVNYGVFVKNAEDILFVGRFEELIGWKRWW